MIWRKLFSASSERAAPAFFLSPLDDLSKFRVRLDIRSWRVWVTSIWFTLNSANKSPQPQPYWFSLSCTLSSALWHRLPGWFARLAAGAKKSCWWLRRERAMVEVASLLLRIKAAAQPINFGLVARGAKNALRDAKYLQLVARSNTVCESGLRSQITWDKFRLSIGDRRKCVSRACTTIQPTISRMD
jgi:hypothetical protein